MCRADGSFYDGSDGRSLRHLICRLFYADDGAPGAGAWVLRAVAVVIGVYGFLIYRRRQNECSIDPKRKTKNLILIATIILIFGVAFFLSLEALSSWYFDAFIVPAQQAELKTP